MVSDVPPPTTVLTLVFLAWSAGTVVGAATTRMWSEVQAGHFKVLWLLSAVLSLATGFGYHPAWVLTLACVITFAAIYRDADRVIGTAAAAVAIVVLATGSDLSPQAFAAAAPLGAGDQPKLPGPWDPNQPQPGT